MPLLVPACNGSAAAEKHLRLVNAGAVIRAGARARRERGSAVLNVQFGVTRRVARTAELGAEPAGCYPCQSGEAAGLQCALSGRSGLMRVSSRADILTADCVCQQVLCFAEQEGWIGSEIPYALTRDPRCEELG